MNNPLQKNNEIEGILLVDKPKGKTSFSIISALRRRLNVQKIGHAGTLDPFATGVVVILVGKNFTRLSDQFLCQDKEYSATIKLGIATDTFDCDGQIVSSSDKIPSQSDVEDAITRFQGEIDQIPPMFSAKKINGKKLYELARKGVVVERKANRVKVETILLKYEYPFIQIVVKCSKGTYIRSIAQEIGEILGCGGHLSDLQRTRSGTFCLQDCVAGDLVYTQGADLTPFLKKLKP